MEKDDEIKGEGNSYTTEFRQYDPRLGRWLSLDPLFKNFPWQSPYVAFDNKPTIYIDPKGLASENAGGGDNKGLVTYNNKVKHKDGSVTTVKSYNHTHVNLQKTGEKYLAETQTTVDRIFDEAGKLLEETITLNTNNKESQSKYIPAPKELPGIPGAERLPNKKGQRPGWKMPDGGLGEWDSQHGEVEVYDKTGKKHKGAWDPESGEQVKPPVPGRKASRAKIETPNSDDIEPKMAPPKFDPDAVKKGTQVGIGFIIIGTLIYVLTPIG